MKQRVLTINVPVTMPWALPYGPAVISGILTNAGFEAETWDLNIDLFQDFNQEKEWPVFSNLIAIRGYTNETVSQRFIRRILSWTRQKSRQHIDRFKPDVIALSVFSSQSLDFVIPLSTILRKLAPNAYIIIGGRGLDNDERTSGVSYAEYYQRYLNVDAVYQGDAENQLLETIKNRQSGLVIAPPVSREELLDIPPANWSGYNFNQYQGYEQGDLRVPITASKGCVRDCTFCDVSGSWPKYVFRTGDSVGQEMVDLYNTTGMNKFEFTDNLVNGSISNFRAMNNVIANQAPNQLDYIGYAICRTRREMPESDFELARVAGASRFKVGIESGSESVRFDMKKKFSNDDINWFAVNSHKYGIQQIWLMFVGYPSETEQDFQDTMRLLEEHKTLAKNGMIQVFLSLPMMLTSGSAFMRNYAIDYGLEHNRTDKWSDFFWTSTKHQENTFDVRVDRWRRFMNKIQDCGYADSGIRQTEKFLELEGLEKIYQDYQRSLTNGKKIIPITDIGFNINKSTHI